ncbi:MAG: ATP-binding cassette domain-containing protein [bacterium]|nr:ATP-binding cassette domain-containing protein [bacterium]
MTPELVEVKDLKVHFPVTSGILRRTTGHVRAVDGISFSIRRGRTLGLVGESGSGKTTTGRALLRLVDITSGTVTLEGVDISAARSHELREIRPKMQMIFQDPLSCLNPRLSVADIIAEPLDENRRLARRERAHAIDQLMDSVGLLRAWVDRFPHEFSGGQCQRIGIARALALKPRLIVCDEPIASLDFSVQAQIVNLLRDLQDEHALAYLFISHDLSMIRHMADDVAVMYLGKIVERAPVNALFDAPMHPYTQALMSAAPSMPGTARRRRIVLEGESPSSSGPLAGCVFRSRCPMATVVCGQRAPSLATVAKDHRVACHLHPPILEPHTS